MIECISFSPDGRWAASGSFDNSIRIWDLELGEELRVLLSDKYIESVAMSLSGSRIVSGYKNIRIWDGETGSELEVMKGHEATITSVVISNDMKLIVSGSKDGIAMVWSMETGDKLNEFKKNDNCSIITEVAISADNKRVAVCYGDKEVCIWNVESGEEFQTFEDMGADLQVIANPDFFPLLTLSQKLETQVENQFHKILCFYSESLSKIRTHPDGKIWSGLIENYLCIIKLEGDVE